MLNERLEKTAVVGAGGKMGRGIALLLLQEQARLQVEKHGWNGTSSAELYLIDPNRAALDSLEDYFRPLLRKYAEKNLEELKSLSPSDRSDDELITLFEEKAMRLLVKECEPGSVKGVNLIFEAAVEDVPLKSALFSKMKEQSPDAYFLTNTSSIPIHLLDEGASLNHRIIGFHFYNPPPVQKLVEIIPGKETDPGLKALAKELGIRLNKSLVPSRDIAGFIGNGHFLRDIAYACAAVQGMGIAIHEAVVQMDEVTSTWMLRPMGIFQLLDYVGLDVAEKIAHVMNTHVQGLELDLKLVKEMPMKGGQTPTGEQKDGFFHYSGRKKVAVYDKSSGNYVDIQTDLGQLPASHKAWKDLLKDPEKDEKLRSYFKELFSSETKGAGLARNYLLASKHAAEELVKTGVAESAEDVNQVMKLGFHHLYGPVNKYF